MVLVAHYCALLSLFCRIAVVMVCLIKISIPTKKKVQKAMYIAYKFWHLLDETLNAILFILIP